MLVRDILKMKSSQAILSAEPEDSLREAVALMVQKDVGSLVVMRGNRMLGMVTFREILAAMHKRGGELGEARVSDVMVRDPVIGSLEDSVDYVRGVMTDHHVRYLPVMNGDNLVGVISFHDVAKAAINMANFENKMLKRYIKNWPEQA